MGLVLHSYWADVQVIHALFILAMSVLGRELVGGWRCVVNVKIIRFEGGN